MSQEALRRALVADLADIGEWNGLPAHVRDSCRKAAAALSEGQAPEPVAQEPYGWATPEGAFTRNTGEANLWTTTRIQHVALYEMPTQTHCQMPTDRAGMDAARAKAIEATGDLLDVTREFRKLQESGCDGWSHEDGWTLMATEDANALQKDALAYRAEQAIRGASK